MEHFEELQDYSRPPSNRSWTAKFALIVIIGCIVLVGRKFMGPKGALAASGWNGDWDSAVQSSQTTGKPALVLFTADWCPACRRLESEVLTDPEVQLFLREKFTLCVVDLSDRTGPNNLRAQQFHVQAIPTMIVYGTDAKEKARTFGMPKEPFVAWLNSKL